MVVVRLGLVWVNAIKILLYINVRGANRLHNRLFAIGFTAHTASANGGKYKRMLAVFFRVIRCLEEMEGCPKNSQYLGFS